MSPRVDALGVDLSPGEWLGKERTAAQPVAGVELQDLGNGGNDIDQPDRVSGGRARPLVAGELDYERDLKRLAVEEDSMLLLAMVQKPLAVVRNEDDQRSIVEPALFQRLEKAAHGRIGEGDLGVVARLELRGEGLRRIEWHVGVIEVEEEEDRVVRCCLQPVLSDGQTVVGRALELCLA